MPTIQQLRHKIKELGENTERALSHGLCGQAEDFIVQASRSLLLLRELEKQFGL